MTAIVGLVLFHDWWCLGGRLFHTNYSDSPSLSCTPQLDFYSFQRFSNRSTGKPLYRDHQRLMFYITYLRILASSPRKFEGKIEFTFTPRLIDMVRYGRLNILGCQAVPLSQAGTHQCGWLIWVIKSRCDD